MKKILICSILLLFLSACSSSTTGPSDQETVVEVYTTAYPLAYFTEQIGGKRVNVESIYPAGANEHTFEPTQRDMISLAEADLLFYIGLGLEGFIESAEDALSKENVKFVRTSDAVTEEELVQVEENHEDGAEDEEENEGNSNETDPHVWISPVLSQKLAKSIKDSLIAEDPEGAEIYEANFEKLIRNLEQLDQAFNKLSNEAENKTFFVSHAAFGYIAKTYNFEQVAVAGLNSQDEPSQRELADIIESAKEKKIKYVVFEQNVSSKVTEIVRNEIGAEAVEMHNLGALTQKDIDNGETYFTLMEKNILVLKTILN